MKESTEQVYRQRILRVQMVIQQNLDRDLSLEELARESYFSEYHFHRIFRAVVGEPLKEYIRRLRLERAASHLKYTSSSITHIAFDAGYQTHEAFTRAFKSAFGCSPSDFRSGNGTTVHYRSDSDKKELNSGEGETPMKVEIKNIEKMRVAFVRHVGPYDQVGKAWD
ncbi:MAG: AraC family transcriptional regulator, partial [Sedimentisphaerales bacterium]|nr:AraC family transcriptional regulator [Sedimentisphaerales bacterium]